MFINKSMTKNVITIGPDAGIEEARKLMEKNGIRHLPVVLEDFKLVGIVTDRDIRSAQPSCALPDVEIKAEQKLLASLKVKDIMTMDPVSISPANTLGDALVLMKKIKVGAFPVVDQEGKLKGIISIRDLIRAFINVLGLEEPGALLGIIVENKVGQMKKIVDAISEEGVSFGSILVARHSEEDKRLVFPYLLTSNVARVKRRLKDSGFDLLDPMEWTLDQLPKR